MRLPDEMLDPSPQLMLVIGLARIRHLPRNKHLHLLRVVERRPHLQLIHLLPADPLGVILQTLPRRPRVIRGLRIRRKCRTSQDHRGIRLKQCPPQKLRHVDRCRMQRQITLRFARALNPVHRPRRVVQQEGLDPLVQLRQPPVRFQQFLPGVLVLRQLDQLADRLAQPGQGQRN